MLVMKLIHVVILIISVCTLTSASVPSTAACNVAHNYIGLQVVPKGPNGMKGAKGDPGIQGPPGINCGSPGIAGPTEQPGSGGNGCSAVKGNKGEPGHAADQTAEITELQLQNVNQSERISDLEQLSENQTSKISALESQNSSYSATFSSLKLQNREQSAKLLDLEQKNLNQSSKILDLEQKTVNQSSKLMDLEQKHLNQSSKILDLEQKNLNQSKRISELEHHNENQESKISALESQNSAFALQDANFTNTISELVLQHANYSARLSELEKIRRTICDNRAGIYIANTCYFTGEGNLELDDAQAACDERGAILAPVTTVEAYNALETFLREIVIAEGKSLINWRLGLRYDPSVEGQDITTLGGTTTVTWYEWIPGFPLTSSAIYTNVLWQVQSTADASQGFFNNPPFISGRPLCAL